MKLAILHYHLNRGGVTQVIVNQLRSLAQLRCTPERVAVLYGGRREGWPAETMAAVEQQLQVQWVPLASLDYDTETAADPAGLAARLQHALQQQGMEAGQTLLHVHNPGLGKNLSLPGALVRLAAEGYRLLIQIHDFAEDFRPGNYRRLLTGLAAGDFARLAAQLYPQAPHIHYATLNQRDAALLRQAGVPAERLHFLPNPLTGFANLPPRESARRRWEQHFSLPAGKRLVLYPVRAIARKNLGELLLWAAAAPSQDHFAVTLAPLNPLELPRYRHWAQLIEQLQLPVLLDTGGPSGLSFGQNLAAADAVITTSLAEGFGMTFLEAWLAGIPLIGRDLPEVTADFHQAGVQFPWLMQRLQLPCAWVSDWGALRQRFEQAVQQTYAAYQQQPPGARELQQVWDRWTADGTIDFALLDVQQQTDIIRLVRHQPPCREQLATVNPQMAAAASVDRQTAARVVAANARVIQQQYTLPVAGPRLWKVYQEVTSSKPASLADAADARQILTALLDPARMHLVRLHA